LANLESANANMIRQKISQQQRYDKLTIQSLEEKNTFQIDNDKLLYQEHEVPLLFCKNTDLKQIQKNTGGKLF
jgi:hypothetical protein